MRLSQEDILLFYKLYQELLVYTNNRFKILEGLNSFQDIKKFPINDINKIRIELYKYPEVINSFVRDNPLNFSVQELEIVSIWNNFVKDKFYVFRYLKNYTIFIGGSNPPKVYGVFALYSSFEEMLGECLPVLIETVLLPFKGRIVYDGVFMPYSFVFGKGIRCSFSDIYEEAKLKGSIITSLPFSGKGIEQSDIEKLKFYLKNERNRQTYRDEISELIEKDESFLTAYHQEMGKIFARTYGRRLKEIGITDAWFAVIEGITVASGVTRDEVEQVLQKILPLEKREFAYIFRLSA